MSKQTDNMTLQTENMLKQTQQLTESLENTALTNISNRDLEMSKIFFEHPDLLPYFFSGEGIKEGNKNYDKVYALAGMRIDLVGTFYDQSRYIPQFKDPNDPAWQAWVRYIKDIFAKSPIMCKTLDHNARWYTSEFVEFAKQGCAQKR
jgi:hypothetical protein